MSIVFGFQARSKVKMLSAAEAAQLLGNKNATPQVPKKTQFTIEEDFPSLAPTTSSLQAPQRNANPKKASSVTIPMSNSWSQQARDNSPAKSSDSEIHSSSASNTKSKKKKKKTKNGNSAEGEKSQPESKKVLSEQVSSNATSESGKKKKKQKQQQAQEQEAEKERTKCQNGKIDSNESNQSKPNVANRENQDPTPDANGRKRSELQIDSLEITENNGSIEDTTNRLLSILRGDNQVPKSSTSSINPPPGFEIPSEAVTNKKSAPPPGFSVKVNSVARPPSNQLTFTNSSGESYPILPSASVNQFVQPLDFQRRNTALMGRVVDILRDPGRQEEFRQMSILFRQGQLSSAAYYKHCVELMGQKAFNECFPEMVVLLPEIERQQVSSYSNCCCSAIFFSPS